MAFVLCFFVAIFVVCFLAAVSESLALSIVTIILSFFLVFDIAPQQLGVGHVPTEAKSYTAQLKEGFAYQLLASVKTGNEQFVLVVKRAASTDPDDVRVIRVNRPVPSEYFTLVDDEPIAIDNPAKKTK